MSGMLHMLGATSSRDIKVRLDKAAAHAPGKKGSSPQQVAAAQARLKQAASKALRSAKAMQSKAVSRTARGKVGSGVKTRAGQVASKLALSASKLLALSDRKVSVATKPDARRATPVAPRVPSHTPSTDAHVKVRVERPKNKSERPAMARPSMAPAGGSVVRAIKQHIGHHLETVVGRSVFSVGEDTTTVTDTAALTTQVESAKQSYVDALDLVQQVKDYLSQSKDAYQKAASNAPDPSDPSYAQWSSNADTAEADYNDAMSIAVQLIFNDTTVADALDALNAANALLAAAQAQTVATPPSPPSAPADASGTSASSGGGGGSSGGGGTFGSSDGGSGDAYGEGSSEYVPGRDPALAQDGGDESVWGDEAAAEEVDEYAAADEEDAQDEAEAESDSMDDEEDQEAIRALNMLGAFDANSVVQMIPGLLQTAGGALSKGGGGGGDSETVRRAEEAERKRREAEQSARTTKIALGVTGGILVVAVAGRVLRRMSR